MSGSKPMSRTEKKLQTRQKLIDATRQQIALEGISSITLAKIAKSLGLSQGVINFHFATKEALMLEVLNQVYDAYLTTWNQANDPKEKPAVRLANIIRALLDPAITNAEDSAVWAGFWSQKATRATYVDIFNEKDQMLRNTLVSIVGQLDDALTLDKQEMIVTNLLAFVSGHELDLLLTPESYNHDNAVQGCLDYINFYFKGHLLS